MHVCDLFSTKKMNEETGSRFMWGIKVIARASTGDELIKPNISRLGNTELSHELVLLHL